MFRSGSWWFAAAVLGVAFVFLSLQEGVYDFSVGLIPGPFHIVPRKTMATVCFAIISYCVARAMQHRDEVPEWSIPVLIGTLFSAFIEVLQHYWERYNGLPIEPKRWNLIDVGTGTLGGFLAAWALSLGRRGRRAPRRPRAEPDA